MSFQRFAKRKDGVWSLTVEIDLLFSLFIYESPGLVGEASAYPFLDVPLGPVVRGQHSFDADLNH